MSIIEEIRNQGVNKEVDNISKSLVGQPLAKNETLEEDLCRSVNTLNKAFNNGDIPVLDLLKAAKNIGKLTKKRKLITRGGRTFLTTVYVDESGTESMSDVAHTAYETPESLKAIEHLHRGDNVRVVRKDGSVVEGSVSGLSGLSSGKIELAVRVEGQKWDKLIDPSTVKSVEKVTPEKKDKDFSWDHISEASDQQLKDKINDLKEDLKSDFAEDKPRHEAQLRSAENELKKRADLVTKKIKQTYEIPGTKDAVDVTGKSKKIPVEDKHKKELLDKISQIKSDIDRWSSKNQNSIHPYDPQKKMRDYVNEKKTWLDKFNKELKDLESATKDTTAKEKPKKEELNSESFKNLILKGYRLKESDIATKHSHRAGYKPTFEVSDDRIYANFSTGDTVMGTGGYYTEYLMRVGKDGPEDYGVVLRISSNKNNYTNDDISDKSVIDYESYPTFEEAKDRLINYLKE